MANFIVLVLSMLTAFDIITIKQFIFILLSLFLFFKIIENIWFDINKKPIKETLDFMKEADKIIKKIHESKDK